MQVLSLKKVGSSVVSFALLLVVSHPEDELLLDGLLGGLCSEEEECCYSARG